MNPRLLHKLSNKCITTISVGAEFSVAMDTAGYVWVWGRADSGQVSKPKVHMSTTSSALSISSSSLSLNVFIISLQLPLCKS